MIKVNSNLFLAICIIISSASGLPIDQTATQAVTPVVQPPLPQVINGPDGSVTTITHYTDSDSALNALNHVTNFQSTLFNQHLYTQQYLFNQFNQLRNFNPFAAFSATPNYGYSFLYPNNFFGNLPFLHNPMSMPMAQPVNPPQYYDYSATQQILPAWPNQNLFNNVYYPQSLQGQFQGQPIPPQTAPYTGQGPIQEPNANQSQKPQKPEESKNDSEEDANEIEADSQN